MLLVEVTIHALKVEDKITYYLGLMFDELEDLDRVHWQALDNLV